MIKSLKKFLKRELWCPYCNKRLAEAWRWQRFKIHISFEDGTNFTVWDKFPEHKVCPCKPKKLS